MSSPRRRPRGAAAPSRALALAAALALIAAAGGERPANRLAQESSPYLRLHAHNPVDWYPWGPEALAKARREDKPIFLSVGYSTCYWCHVMEREAFSDDEIAELMNRWFVSIKVDREERPELDEIYMTATRLLARGRGGWPNSVFLTPELEPFYAGTYFPIEDRGGRPGFRKVLEALHDAWENRRDSVEARAAEVAGQIREVLGERREPAAEAPGVELAAAALSAVKGRYDGLWGGFGRGMKFPNPGSLMLLREAAERGDDEAAAMVVATLEHMGRGAIYDQLDGGFHRYTLDRAWRVPHFEKMLYDNAQLAELLAETWETTRAPDLERLARGTLDFVLAEMTLPEGPFKSAIDAETDGEEGAFYVWTDEELRAALDEKGHALLAPLLGFDGEPNFEGGRHTLFLPAALGGRASVLELDRAELLRRIAEPLERLREARRKRPFPRVDDKVLTDWNGMMIAALARAGELFDEPRYQAAAVRAARFVLARLRGPEGQLLHAWRGGAARIPAFLDDYAFLVHGLLALADATGENVWLAHAERLAGEAERRLGSAEGGYYLSEEAPDLLVRPKTVSGGAIPSGNAVMLRNLLELAERTGNDGYRRQAELGLRAFAGELERNPAGTPVLALALLEARGTAAAGDRPAGAGRRRRRGARRGPAHRRGGRRRLAALRGAARDRRRLARQRQPGLDGVPGADPARRPGARGRLPGGRAPALRLRRRGAGGLLGLALHRRGGGARGDGRAAHLPGLRRRPLFAAGDPGAWAERSRRRYADPGLTRGEETMTPIPLPGRQAIAAAALLLSWAAPAAATNADLEAAVARMARIGGCWSPSLSPGGDRLAFVSDLNGVPQVWTIAAAGGFPRLVTAFDDQVGGVELVARRRLAGLHPGARRGHEPAALPGAARRRRAAAAHRGRPGEQLARRLEPRRPHAHPVVQPPRRGGDGFLGLRPRRRRDTVVGREPGHRLDDRSVARRQTGGPVSHGQPVQQQPVRA